MPTELIVNTLIAQYGLPGIVIVAMGWAIWTLTKRNRMIEDRSIKLEISRNEQMVKFIKDSNEKVGETTAALSKLTGCLISIKESLDRIERSKELNNLKSDIKDSST